MRRAVLIGWAIAGLAGGALAEVPRPPSPDWASAAEGCGWQWRAGGGIGLWAEGCALGTGQWDVAWSDGHGAFVQRRDAVVLDVVVWPVALSGAEGLTGLRDRLIADGLLDRSARCAFRPLALRPMPPGVELHALVPLAGAPAAVTASGAVPVPPCGPWGTSTHGVRYAWTHADRRDLVVLVDEGQERPMFDPHGITPLP